MCVSINVQFIFVQVFVCQTAKTCENFVEIHIGILLMPTALMICAISLGHANIWLIQTILIVQCYNNKLVIICFLQLDHQIVIV